MNSSSKRKIDELNEGDPITAGIGSNTKRKVVRIAEDRNVTHLLEQAEQQHGDKKVIELTPKGVRQAYASLVKSVERNELQRAKHPDEADQYMESELLLYEQIEVLKSLAADSKLYPIVCETDMMSTLTRLLLHENSDIAEAVLAVWLEWFDPSLLQTEDPSAESSPLLTITGKLVEESLEPIVANLARLSNESNDDVGQGVENVLQLVEYLLEIDSFLDETSRKRFPQSISFLFCKRTPLCSWLMDQVASKSPVKQKSLEILDLLTTREEIYTAISDWSKIPPYTSVLSEKETNGSTIDAIEVLLQEVASFRNVQPKDDDEVDTIEDAAIVMSSILTYAPLNIQHFLDAQGVELLVVCLKERVHAGGVILKWLDLAGTEDVHKILCERIVEVGTLKYLFPILTGKHLPKGVLLSKGAKREWKENILETTIRILYSLTVQLDDKSPHDALNRLVTKFLDEEKMIRLVSLLIDYDKRARFAEYEFYRSDLEETLGDQETVQFAALSAKLQGGGDIFHRLGAIAAFCCIKSKRCSDTIAKALKEQGSGIGLIRASIEEFVSVLADSSPAKKLLGSYLPILE